MPRATRTQPLVCPFPRLLDYTETRPFLRAWFKANRRAYAVRGIGAFAEAAGCSGGQVNNVLAKRRPLQGPLVDGFARAAALIGFELDYWRLMVRLSEEALPSERPTILDEMAQIRARVGDYPHPTTETILALRAIIQPLHGTPMERYLAKWIHPVLLALSGCPDFRPKMHALAAALHGRATPTQVRQALDELVALGLAAWTEDGGLRPTGKVLESEGIGPVGTYQLHHEQDMDVARAQLFARGSTAEFELSREQIRHISFAEMTDAVTAAISEVGSLAERQAGPGWCTTQTPIPPDGAPRPDRALEVAFALLPMTLAQPAAPIPPPFPLVRRKPGRPPKARPP